MNISFFGAALRRAAIEHESDAETGIAGTTALYTEQGPIPAFLLSPGDRVIRRGKGPVTVRSVNFDTHCGKMVRISPDALGRARPDSFVLLPPDQRLFLRDFHGALFAGSGTKGIFAVRDLIDHDRVTWHRPEEPVRLVRLGFDAREIVHAGGLELEIG